MKVVSFVNAHNEKTIHAKNYFQIEKEIPSYEFETYKTVMITHYIAELYKTVNADNSSAYHYTVWSGFDVGFSTPILEFTINHSGKSTVTCFYDDSHPTRLWSVFSLNSFLAKKKAYATVMKVVEGFKFLTFEIIQEKFAELLEGIEEHSK